MSLITQDLILTLEELFPKASGPQMNALEEIVSELLEGKDLGRFKGDISIFKQRAIDTANSLPRPIITRRQLEKSASRELDKLVQRFELNLLSLFRRFILPQDSSRKLTKTQFQKQAKTLLNVAYLKAYELGTKASGLTRAKDLSFHTSADEKMWIESITAQEQRYFNKLLRSITGGTESIKRAQLRFRNYANAVRSVYEASRVLQLPEDSIIHWMLESNNPCLECRLLHRLSPYTRMTLPTTPKGGSTRCLSNCYCKLRTVRAKNPGQIISVERRNRSSDHILRQLKLSRKRKK